MIGQLERAIELYEKWKTGAEGKPPKTQEYWVDEMLKDKSPDDELRKYFNERLQEDTPLGEEYSQYHGASVGHLPRRLFQIRLDHG